MAAALQRQAEFESVAGTAHAARELVRGAVKEANGSAQLVDKTVLLTNEVVTNAILHGRGRIAVRIETDGRFARVDVADGDANLPSPRSYDVVAETGRGLALVEMMATAWGSRRQDNGKIVWFQIGDRPDDGDLAPPVEATTVPATPARPPGAVRVRVIGLPVDVYLEAQAHNDALLREFTLLRASTTADQIPRRLLEVMDAIGAGLGTQSAASRGEVDAALAAGADTLDYDLWLSPDIAPYARQLTALLDEADAFCEQEGGPLLIVAATPSVRRFRAWYLGEVVRQLDGLPPTPWQDAPAS